MRPKYYILFLLTFCLLLPVCTKQILKDYPIKPVAFTAVQIADGFWLPRMETNRTVTIPFALKSVKRQDE